MWFIQGEFDRRQDIVKEPEFQFLAYFARNLLNVLAVLRGEYNRFDPRPYSAKKFLFESANG